MPDGRGPSHYWLALAAAVALAGAACGCQPECGEKQTIRYEAGQTDPTGTVYQSTPITGPWLHFPPQRTYALVHKLRTQPVKVDIDLSFEERGGNLAPSAGNQSIWHVDSDPNEPQIYVKNDTCAEFYVYVVAYAAPDPGPDGGDADTDASTD